MLTAYALVTIIATVSDCSATRCIKRNQRNEITSLFSSDTICGLTLVKNCSIGRVFAHACDIGGSASAFAEALNCAILLLSC